ncbi:hypothetical protein V8C37DRAFT_398882 [Trichoderma ceciliae]
MNDLLSNSCMYGSNPRDSSQIPEQYNLSQFYSDSDGPWFPVSVIQPAETLKSQSRTSTSAFNNGPRDFQDYRSTGLPSECDTVPGDSGYGGSRSTYSIVESFASLNENDRCTDTTYLETQTAEQLIGDLRINSAVPVHKAPEATYHQARNVKPHRCEQCYAAFKTKSELKKHMHRHVKPYKCTYKDCAKAINGFSTPNDLVRHKRTVHREHESYGPVYICREVPCIHKKEKLWPRADNFRSHLARTHKIDLKADSDLIYYRHQSEAAGSHELQDGRSSVTLINPRPRPVQPQYSPVYTCRHGPCSQKNGGFWPTADSFRVHLAHAHSISLKADNELDHYRYQSAAAEPHALRGVGSLVADVDPGPRPTQLQDSPDLRSDQVSTTTSSQVQNESSEQSSLPLPIPRPPSGVKSHLMRPSILDDPALTSVPSAQHLASNALVETASAVEDSLEEAETTLPRDESRQVNFVEDEGNLVGGEEEIPDLQDPSSSQAVSPDAPIQPKAAAPRSGIPKSQKSKDESGDVSGGSTEAPVDSLTFNSRNTSELFTFLKTVPLEKALKDGTSDVLSFLRTIPKDLLEKALKREDQAANGNNLPSDQPDQQKTPSMFGSKNDWKRHESSQHFQMESWNCDFPGCDKVLPRREQFKTHLEHNHKLTDGQVIENKLESCRLGRHCDPRFWCGFCDKFIEIRKKVLNSWTKRCDHIDSHLFGKDGMEKKTMNEWCYLEDKLAEGNSEPNKKRKATEDLGVRPKKKANFIWRCCLCFHVENFNTSRQCMENHCGHQRCTFCKLEPIPDLDHEDEPMRQEEGK